MKKIGIIGSTGSIGKQTLDVISMHQDKYEIVFLSCKSNFQLLHEQINKYSPKYAVTTSPFRESHTYSNTKILSGDNTLIDIIKNEEIDLIVSSAVGFAGILPTYEAALRGIDIALANKETIVAAGKLIKETAANNGCNIIPVDSEHSAIFQCLMGQKKEFVKKIILTASGGPFRIRPEDALKFVSVEETLRHPNWSMGAKITVDSATMMNKGLEMIEARFLFDIPPSSLDVLIHPQSIIHSMVAFKDGSILAQMGYPDMRTPISLSLSYPDRIESGVEIFDLSQLHALTFHKLDTNKYKCFDIALKVLEKDKNSLMIAMNAANELAVEYFLKNVIRFDTIAEIIEQTLEYFSEYEINTIDEILELDSEARFKSVDIIKKLQL